MSDTEGKLIIRPSKPKAGETTGGVTVRPGLSKVTTELTSKLRIGVSPPGYDNINEVLKKLGYSFETVVNEQLHNTESISRFDVLFINCSERCLTFSSSNPGPVLRDYVALGGSIYASDYAASYVNQAFPNYFNYRAGGEAGSCLAEVTDKGLEQLLGKTINLTFDLGNWRLITYLASGHRKYLVDASTKRPLMVSFRHEQGQVVYTSFHNHAQPTETEKKLLEVLVLKPIVAQASARTETMREDEIAQLAEIPSMAYPEQKYSYFYHNPTSQNLVFIVNWSGSGAGFRLSVWHPSAALCGENESEEPPCRILAAGAEPGLWRYEVGVLKIPYPGFPYVTMAGPEGVLSKALPRGTS